MTISETAYLLLLAMLVVERVFEVFISRRHARWAFANGGIEVGRDHYRIMVLMHTVFLASCAVESAMDIWAIPPILSAVALASTFFAQFLRYSAVVTLGEYWNTRIVVLPNAVPITRGLYRWMRHPNYVAVVIEIAALPLIRACWITAIVFTIANALILRVRIPAEERALGDTYSAAFGGVARFFPHRRSAEVTTDRSDDASPQ
jgi:methyltransferase